MPNLSQVPPVGVNGLKDTANPTLALTICGVSVPRILNGGGLLHTES
jgi:hypothetical protein